jgi:hypothetical protein
MSAALQRNGAVLAYPWTLCARVVGSKLDFKVWPSRHREPAWGDATYSRTITLPPDAPTTGTPGFFIGHLEPGGYADFTKLTTSTVVHEVTAPSPNPVGG